jgi:hypothetical protein
VPELQNLHSKINDFPVLRWPLIPHGKTKQLDRLHTAQLGLRYLLSLLPPPPTRPPPGLPPSTSGSSTLPPTTTHTASPRPRSTSGSSIGAPQAATQTQPRRTNTGRSVSFQPRPPVGASSPVGGQRNPAPPTRPRGTSQQSCQPPFANPLSLRTINLNQ